MAYKARKRKVKKNIPQGKAYIHSKEKEKLKRMSQKGKHIFIQLLIIQLFQ